MINRMSLSEDEVRGGAKPIKADMMRILLNEFKWPLPPYSAYVLMHGKVDWFKISIQISITGYVTLVIRCRFHLFNHLLTCALTLFIYHLDYLCGS